MATARFPLAEAAFDYDDRQALLRIGDDQVWLGSYTDPDREALSAFAGR